jgi:hypothetical protein
MMQLVRSDPLAPAVSHDAAFPKHPRSALDHDLRRPAPRETIGFCSRGARV